MNAFSDSSIEAMSTDSSSKKRKLDESQESAPPKKKRKVDKQETKSSVKPISKHEFMERANNEEVGGDLEFVFKKRIFKTGSVGYNTASQTVIALDDEHSVAVMVSANAIVKDSKSWDEGESKEEKKEGTKPDKKKRAGAAKGCTMTKTAFLDKAKDLTVTLFGTSATLKPKQFSTGSVGWGYSARPQHDVGGVALRLNVIINLVVKKSKQWEKGSEAEEKGVDDGEDKNAVEDE